jgi:metal-sulfur cluster biosynthetic enzyme
MSYTSEKVKEYLKAVIDPELGITIVDLGLIYGVEFPTESSIRIKMTLTSMGCPLFGTIHDDIVHSLTPLGYAADQVEVDLVWDPPWNQSMMSEEAKAELGIE